MRTTLTLDDDLAEELRTLAHRTRRQHGTIAEARTTIDENDVDRPADPPMLKSVIEDDQVHAMF